MTSEGVGSWAWGWYVRAAGQLHCCLIRNPTPRRPGLDPGPRFFSTVGRQKYVGSRVEPGTTSEGLGVLGLGLMRSRRGDNYWQCAAIFFCIGVMSLAWSCAARCPALVIIAYNNSAWRQLGHASANRW